MKKLFFTSILCLAISILFSQSLVIDSLENLLSSETLSDNEAFSINTQIGEKYFLLSFDSCQNYVQKLNSEKDRIDNQSYLIDYYLFAGRYYTVVKQYTTADSLYQKADLLIQKTKDQKRQCILYKNIGKRLRMDMATDSAIVYFKKGLDIAQKNGFKKLEGLCLYNLGINYDYKGSYEKSFENYYKALALQEQLGDKNDLANTYKSIGVTHRSYSLNNDMDAESFNKYREYLEKALDLVDVSENLLIHTLCNIEMGNYYGIKNDFENSISHLDLAENYALKLNSSTGLKNIYSSKGNLYSIKGELVKAKSYYKKEEAILVKEGNKNAMAGLYYNYGFLESKLGNFDGCITNFKRALKLATTTKQRRMQESILRNMSLAFSKNNNYKEAYKFQKERQLLRDSLRNEKNAEAITELEVKYETEKLEQEKIILQRDQVIANAKNKRLLTGLVVFLCSLPFILWFAIRENKRKRNEIRLNEQLANQNKIVEKANHLLAEKNIEIMHRTRNNLSMLSIFMKQEARRIDDPQAKNALLETENRLQTISLIDHQLAADQEVAINLNEYPKNLNT